MIAKSHFEPGIYWSSGCDMPEGAEDADDVSLGSWYSRAVCNMSVNIYSNKLGNNHTGSVYVVIQHCGQPTPLPARPAPGPGVR